uniref:Uncharacterized protein n=1 Tax=Arundo donax TaxID=35708 RepID=A0A0A9ED92_ARUDO
MDQSNLPSHDS